MSAVTIKDPFDRLLIAQVAGMTVVCQDAIITQYEVPALGSCVFLISGETGADVMNKVLKPGFQIQYGGTAMLGKTNVYSIEHPSRTSYAYIAVKIGEILRNIPQ